jgi:general secretion pathway protein H
MAPTARQAEKVLMPISVRGSSRGFTLIELLVVVALIAIATATVGLSLRDGNQAQLEREAERLVALLETARAEARAAGLTVRWQIGGQDSPAFKFSGLSKRVDLPDQWLGDPVSVDFEGGRQALLLGPEPLLPAQAVRLRLGDRQLRISTDGLQPFSIQY